MQNVEDVRIMKLSDTPAGADFSSQVSKQCGYSLLLNKKLRTATFTTYKVCFYIFRDCIGEKLIYK